MLVLTFTTGNFSNTNPPVNAKNWCNNYNEILQTFSKTIL
jgi:hypothetical protein